MDQTPSVHKHVSRLLQINLGKKNVAKSDYRRSRHKPNSKQNRIMPSVREIRSAPPLIPARFVARNLQAAKSQKASTLTSSTPPDLRASCTWPSVFASPSTES